MKPIRTALLLLLSIICLYACEEPNNENIPNTDKTEDIEDKPIHDEVVENIKLQENVISYGPEVNNYFYIIDNTTLRISSDASESVVPKVGEIIYYHSGDSSAAMFIGTVVSVTPDEEGWLIKTEIPSVEQIFESLSLNMSMDSSNTQAFIDLDSEDNITSCSVVANSVWDNIVTIYDETESEDDDAKSESKANISTPHIPVNITLELKMKKSDYCDGTIFIGLSGYVYMPTFPEFVMDVHMRIGVNAALHVEAKDKKEFPLLQLKKGITLYTNKLLSIRIVPSLNFYVNGTTSLESVINYELINSDINFTYSNNDFQNSSVDRKRDNYFRVKSVKSEGSFGFNLEGKLYAFLFSESFFSVGADIAAGLGIEGEKNIGIQFPGLVNFNYKINGVPYVEMTPFFAINNGGGLVYKRGPKLKKQVVFPIPLIPSIYDLNYAFKDDYKVSVEGSIEGRRNSFVETTEEGIALFRRGKEKPEEHKQIDGSRSSIGNLQFSLPSDELYEIAPYVETTYDGYIYGERILLTATSLREQLIELYKSTDGDNWTNNDNWCSDKPIDEWYGVVRSHDEDGEWEDGYYIFLDNNNLKGTAVLHSPYITEVSMIYNQLTGIDFYGCTSLRSVNCCGNKLKKVDFSECSSLNDVNFNTAWQNEIVDLTDLNMSGCSSLESLWVTDTALSNLNLDGCTSLKSLQVNKNDLSLLNLSDCTSLESVNVSDNNLTSLDLEVCDSLEILLCNNNNLTTLDLSNHTVFKILECCDNQITELNLSGCAFKELAWFDEEFDHGIFGNPIEKIDLSDCKSLTSCNISNVATLTDLNLSGCASLSELFCSDNKLTSLDLSGCTSLVGIDCWNNNLTSLDLSGCTSLMSVDVINNKLTSLDLTSCSNLVRLRCSNNSIVSLNVTGCSSLRTVFCNNNKISREISGLFADLSYFMYDQRYTGYWWEVIIGPDGKVLGRKLHYTDNGVGWWYPGEPERGYH